ncbi:hypothetical protein AB0D13_31405 [Streptomyces sp. NPDC048430]|uniref:hypothetical protein n=1 Tax=unclassified Streptomyces TaxID=2593676 RepID=UPI00343E5677
MMVEEYLPSPAEGTEPGADTVPQLVERDSRKEMCGFSLVLTDDSPIHFTANLAKNGWIPEQGAEEMVLKGSVSGAFSYGT